jgi:primosomal protein N''
MRKQTQGMNRPINNWRQRRIEHRVYEEIITDITTRNSERKDKQ